jgi:hypothetical protein
VFDRRIVKLVLPLVLGLAVGIFAYWVLNDLWMAVGAGAVTMLIAFLSERVARPQTPGR